MTAGTPTTAPAGSRPVVAATAVLTCAAAVLGALVAWPSPERTTSAGLGTVLRTLSTTGLLGVVPLLVAVAVTRVRR